LFVHSFQFSNAFQVLAQFGTIIVDEAHHIAARTLSQALPKLPARYVVGLTATPTRADGLEHALYWLLGPAVFMFQRTREMRALTGIGLDVDVIQIAFEPSDGPFREISYKSGPAFAIMVNVLCKHTERNALIVAQIREAFEEGRRTLVLTDRKIHARRLAESCMHVGVPIKLLLGGEVTDDDIALAKFSDVVCATYNLVGEGFDAPAFDTLVLASPRGNVQQFVGRIEREHDDKKRPRVIDIVDKFSLFEGMSWKRFRFYKSRGFRIDRVDRVERADPPPKSDGVIPPH